MRTVMALLLASSVFLGPTVSWAQAPPPPAQPAGSSQGTKLTDEKIDQLMAPIALYPDSLLAQVLMASTYPDQVAQAAKWSKDHPELKGDDAVEKVASQPWDPSVQSLVAFPQVLATLKEKPDWVKQLGDAFLAEPEAMMDSAQRLREMAQKSGNLKSNEQQQVEVEQPAPEQTIIKIVPANPQVVYVPTYNPTVVYGAWPYPAYPPFYLPRPIGYGIAAGVATGVAFGIGVGVHNAMWGGFNWGRRDVNINVNRYNRVNVHRQLNVSHNSWTRNNQTRINSARAHTSYHGTVSSRNVNRQNVQHNVNAQGRNAQRAQAQQRVQQRQPGAYQGNAQQRAQSVNRGQAQQRAQSAHGGQGQAQQRAQSVNRGQAQQRAQSAHGGQGQAQQRAQSVNRGQAQQRAQSVNRGQAQQRAQSAHGGQGHARSGAGRSGGGRHR